MPDLAAFQHAFLALLDAPQPGALAIYRNTVIGGAVDALADNFPICRRIVGEEAFMALAVEFAAGHPPRDAVLARYGSAFPGWLERHECSDDLPYFAEVAACERLWAECLHGADAPPLVPADLVTLAPETLLGARIPLHPAARFGWFDTPAMPIWLAHQDVECIECAPEWIGSGALFTRPGHAVIGQTIDRATFHLLGRLADGEALGAASEAVLAEVPDADISGALALLLASGALARIC